MESKVNFYLHAPNSSTLTPLMMVCNYGFKTKTDGESKSKYHRLKLAVGWSIYPKDWSQEFQQLLPQCRNPQKNKINSDLGSFKKKVMDSLQYFLFQGILPSIEELREKILDEKPLQLYNKKTVVVDYIQKYQDTCIFKKNTTKNYTRLKNKIVAFQNKFKKTLYFETMNGETFREFFKYAGEKKLIYRQKDWENITKNTLADYKKNFRKFCNEAKNSGIQVHMDYKLKEFTAVYEVADAVYLSMSRIHQLVRYDLNLAGRPGLQLTKDLLLIGCYTALRISDWDRLGNLYYNRAGEPYLKVRTKKSGRKQIVSLPVYSPILEIYQRYGNKFPSPPTEQKFNKSVKKLGKLIGWNELVKVTVTRVYGKKEEYMEEYPFYSLLSSHSGRRSFATNSYMAGVNPRFIMLFTLHQKIKDFFGYIKLTAEDNVDQFLAQTKDFFEPSLSPGKDSFRSSSESFLQVVGQNS